MQILSYGGGRQTVALLILIKRGTLPRPDRIVIADTGRENPSTWEYRDEIAEPLAQSIGLTIEIAPRSLAYVDLYGHNGDLLLPVYTATCCCRSTRQPAKRPRSAQPSGKHESLPATFGNLVYRLANKSTGSALHSTNASGSKATTGGATHCWNWV